jgi:hypothetical protein
MPIKVNPTNPLNLKVLAYLEPPSVPGAPLVAGFEPGEKPYLRHGSHPDVVQRLWDEINPTLPEDSRCLVNGYPALVHPTKGILLGFTSGTHYYLRLPLQIVKEAENNGAKKILKFSSEKPMDVHKELGDDWVAGSYWGGEISGCEAMFNQVEVG